MDDENELDRREHEYVARVLGISTNLLDCHPYRIDEDNGSTATWRVLWTEGPPDQVKVYEDSGTVWTGIPSLFNTGGPNAQGS